MPSVGCCVFFPVQLSIELTITPFFQLFVLSQFSSVNNQSHEIVESYEGTGISPFVHTQNSLSLTVGGYRTSLVQSSKVLLLV